MSKLALLVCGRLEGSRMTCGIATSSFIGNRYDLYLINVIKKLVQGQQPGYPASSMAPPTSTATGGGGGGPGGPGAPPPFGSAQSSAAPTPTAFNQVFGFVLLFVT